MSDIDTWWSDGKKYRLTLHKCAHCGQKKVAGVQSHSETSSPPEGIRSQYGNYNWIIGGRGKLGLLLCESCLHFEDRIAERKRLQRIIDDSMQKLKEVHEATRIRSPANEVRK